MTQQEYACAMGEDDLKTDAMKSMRSLYLMAVLFSKYGRTGSTFSRSEDQKWLIGRARKEGRYGSKASGRKG